MPNKEPGDGNRLGTFSLAQKTVLKGCNEWSKESHFTSREGHRMTFHLCTFKDIFPLMFIPPTSKASLNFPVNLG